jgi:hypothetical protein
MIDLKQYLSEEIGASVSTPMNTMGMGDPQMPNDNTPGSEPLPIKKRSKKKKEKV